MSALSPSPLPLTPARRIAHELHNELGVIHRHFLAIELDLARRGFAKPAGVEEMRAALQRPADLTRGLLRA